MVWPCYSYNSVQWWNDLSLSKHYGVGLAFHHNPHKIKTSVLYIEYLWKFHSRKLDVAIVAKICRSVSKMQVFMLETWSISCSKNDSSHVWYRYFYLFMVQMSRIPAIKYIILLHMSFPILEIATWHKSFNLPPCLTWTSWQAIP
jgi:hypothetical protein